MIEPLAERVDHADTHAVQTARDLVALAAELAAGVQHGEDDLGRTLALVRAGGIRIDRDAAPVVVDADAAVGQQGDPDARAVARHRLVDSVVDDLPDEVVKTGQTGGSDVHAGPLADGVETLEHLDVLGAVIGGSSVRVGGHSHLDRSQEKQAETWMFVGDPTAAWHCRRGNCRGSRRWLQSTVGV